MRLNIGAGDWRPDGYTTVDIEAADIAHDLRQTPYPFPDNCATAILASHILEHLDRTEGAAMLAECARILRPGGVLAIAVPNLDTFVDCWRSGDFAPLAGYAWTNINALMGGGWQEPRPHWRHQSVYGFAALAWACQSAGLVANRVTFDGSRLGAIHQPAYKAISLYVDAVKP